MKNKVLLIGLAALIAAPAASQSKKPLWPNGDAKRWMLGVQAGTSVLTGDAQKLGFSYAAGLNAQYNWGHSFGMRAVFNVGQVKGSDLITDRPWSRYEYTNNYWETQIQGIFTLGNISYLRKARKFVPYLGAGIGIINSDAQSTFVLKSDPNGTVQNGTYTGITPTFGAVVGGRYNLNKSLSLGIEYNFRYTGSDELDVLNNFNAGNKSKDAVNLLQVTASFKLGKKGQEHVEFINPVESIYEDISKLNKKVEELSGDADGDGVADYFDKDNTTPAGANVYGNGKAVDTDGDGVPDVNDVEPNSPKGAKVDEKGKAADQDNDGVPDVLDLSPNTDTAYMVNHQGIPIMTKDLARKLAPKGGLGMSGGVGVLPAILFQSGSAKVSPIHYIDLQGIAESIKRADGLKILIIGNADFRGSDKTNESLALKRAEAVKKILVENFGVNPDQLQVQSNGERVPIANGTDPLSLQANRRVQFFIVE